MTLWSTQPLTEMSTRNVPGGKGRPQRKADKLTAISEPIVYKMADLDASQPYGPFMACYRDRLNFTFSNSGHVVSMDKMISL
jgi:hypothetical protein